MKRTILLDTDPLLRVKSSPYPLEEVNGRYQLDARLKALIEDMLETMKDAEGIGLAAPQIGEHVRVVVLTDMAGRDIGIVNPEIVEPKGSSLGPEACLSVPKKSGLVERASSIHVQGALVVSGRIRSLYAYFSGMTARVIQHEVDHLDGILFTDKMVDFPSF